MTSFEQKMAAVKAAAYEERLAGEARDQRAAQLFGQGITGEELFPSSGAVIREFLSFMCARRSPNPGYLVGVVTAWPLKADIQSISDTISSGESYMSYAPTRRRIAQINSYALPLYLGVDGSFRASHKVPFPSIRTDARSPYDIPNTGGVIRTVRTTWHEDSGPQGDEPAIPYLRLLELEELLPIIAAGSST